MTSEEWIAPELAALDAQQLRRRLVAYPEAGGKICAHGKTYLNFSSNDYLDLAHHPEVIAASRDALERYGCGATASRLVTGTLALHEQLERALADHKGYPAALAFGSGFLANAGVIPALVGRGDTLLVDRLAHASILDAAHLSRARLQRFQHNDVDHLEALLAGSPDDGRKLVVTESVFSMDGDLAPLADIASAAQAHHAMLMVDEAHATGVFGPGGAGLVSADGLQQGVNVSMGTLSKALGGYGGFVACSAAMRELLVSRARAFIYTTGLPPAAAGAALGAIEALRKDEDLGAGLLQNAGQFRQRLHEAGLDTGRSGSQIVPVIVGDNERTLRLAQGLHDAGILAVAIRPPTVPQGSARLRLSVTLAHTASELEWAAGVISEQERLL